MKRLSSNPLSSSASARKKLSAGALGLLALLICLSVYKMHQYHPIQSNAATPSATSSANPPASFLADTTDNIHMAIMGNYNMSNPADVSGKVDVVWNAMLNTQVTNVTNLYYLMINADAHPTVTRYDLAWFLNRDPDKSYVVNGTTYKLSQIHPNWKTWTWIVYQCDRKTPAYILRTPNVPIDYANSDVLTFLTEQYIQPAFSHGIDGIALDNVFAINKQKACGTFTASDNWQEIKYSSWIQDEMQTFSALIHTINPHAYVAINSPVSNAYTPDQVQEFLPYTDIHVDERGFTTLDNPYTTGTYVTDQDWLAKVKQYAEEQNSGKPLIIVDLESVPPPDLERAKLSWDLANYLLVKGSHTYLVISGPHYGSLYDRPEYHIPIGHPTDSMHYYLSPQQKLETRNYSGGKVWVNFSSNQTCSFVLQYSYKDLYGTQLAKGTKITLAPHSGLVLLL